MLTLLKWCFRYEECGHVPCFWLLKYGVASIVRICIYIYPRLGLLANYVDSSILSSFLFGIDCFSLFFYFLFWHWWQNQVEFFWELTIIICPNVIFFYYGLKSILWLTFQLSTAYLSVLIRMALSLVTNQQGLTCVRCIIIYVHILWMQGNRWRGNWKKTLRYIKKNRSNK